MGIETAIAFIASTTGVSTTVATAIFTVASSFVLSAASAYLTKKGLKGSPGVGSRTITSKGTVDPQKIVYGEALVAGTLAYHNTHGTKNREMWAVHLLAGHECDSISDVYLDDKLISDSEINGGAAAGGAVTTGDYGPVRGLNVVELYKELGTSTQTVNTALDTASSDWGTNHRLRGITYGVSMFALWDKTETLWEAGDPTNVKWLVRGKKVYDPRLDSTAVIDTDTSPETTGSGSHRVDDSTTWEWSDNPALCTADFLMDAKFSPLAGGIDSSRIDWESVAKAADVCDELVVIPPDASPQNTEKRFTCNGVLFGSETPEENAKALLGSMNGSIVLSGDKYYIHAGSYVAPLDSLSEDDIIGPIGIRSALDSEQRINTLKAIYIDPDKKYEQTETANITFTAYKDTRDGGDELIETLELPLTNSWYMAQRICQLQLQEADQELTVTIPCNLKAARFEPGDRINVTITERGWTPKIFKVLSWEFFDRGGNQLGVNLDLREDDAAAYTDPIVSEYNTTTQNGTLTIADPEPVPGLDTIPENINYGGGAWNVDTDINQDQSGSASDGDIRLQAGVFVTRTGAIRTLSNNAHVSTPYTGSTTPPDGIGYIISGSTTPDTRFGSGTYGDSDAEGAGYFAAIFDRTRAQWYAVDDAENETAFTPADDDYVVYRYAKASSTGGLDWGSPVAMYVNDPEATVGAQLGVNLTWDGATPVDADDISKPAPNMFNPVMTLRRWNADDDQYMPAHFYIANTTDGYEELYYQTNYSVLGFGGVGSDDTIGLYTAAIPVKPGMKIRQVVKLRGATASASGLSIRWVATTDDLSPGTVFVSGSTNSPDSAIMHDTNVTVYTGTSSEVEVVSGGTDHADDPVPSSYTTYINELTVPANVKWVSANIFNGAGHGASAIWVDLWDPYVIATENTGALADQDTVSQFDIELYAATRVGFSSGASSVSLATSGWKTLDSVDITLPADVTDSIVLVEVVVSIAGNDVTSSTSQGQTLVSARLLDDDSTVVETTSMDFLYIRNIVNASSTRVARGQLTFAFRVPSSALNTSQANTFTFQLNGGVSGYTSITGAVLMMRATLHNQSE